MLEMMSGPQVLERLGAREARQPRRRDKDRNPNGAQTAGESFARRKTVNLRSTEQCLLAKTSSASMIVILRAVMVSEIRAQSGPTSAPAAGSHSPCMCHSRQNSPNTSPSHPRNKACCRRADDEAATRAQGVRVSSRNQNTFHKPNTASPAEPPPPTHLVWLQTSTHPAVHQLRLHHSRLACTKTLLCIRRNLQTANLVPPRFSCSLATRVRRHDVAVICISSTPKGQRERLHNRTIM
jgi:hypothetical protein